MLDRDQFEKLTQQLGRKSVNDAGPDAAQVATPRIPLLPGSRISMAGKELIVDRRLGDTWSFLSHENEPAFKTDIQLAQLMAKGEFYAIWQPTDGNLVAKPLEPLNVGERTHEENMRKLDYVEACRKRHRSRRVLKPIIREIYERRRQENEALRNSKPDWKPEPNVPGFTTVLGWIERYGRHFELYGPAALATRHDRKGNRSLRYERFQEEAIAEGIKVWLKLGVIAAAYASVVDHVRSADKAGLIDRNMIKPSAIDQRGNLAVPSLRQFQRRCGQVDPRVRDAMHIGMAHVRKNYRTFSTMPLPERPYQEVEVDHCTLDLLLVHESGLLLGRPDLIAFRDRATAMIIGVAVTFEYPSYSSFLSGLEAAFYPKDLSQNPLVRRVIPVFGRIENLFVDNALHLIGRNIEEAARCLGMTVSPLAPRQPWLKGGLERFFRSLNSGLVHLQPGTTLSNVVARRDHENLGAASLTVAQFRFLLDFWVYEIYNASNHKALGFIRGIGNQTPYESWAAKTKDYLVDFLPKPELFVAMAGDVHYRTLQRNGFVIDYVIYEGPELARLQASPKHVRASQGGMATKYKLTRDPRDLSCVYLHNHHDGTTLKIMATPAHRKYAEGLTLSQHQIVLANAKELYGKDPGFEGLMKAKAKLNQIALAVTKSPSFKSVQRKIARWMEGDRLRAIRANVDTFAPPTGDYLVPPAQTSSFDVASQTLTQSEMESSEEPPSCLDEDDLNELRKSKQWNSSYD